MADNNDLLNTLVNRQANDPTAAWQKAATIGAPQGNWTPLTTPSDPPLIQLAHSIFGNAQRDPSGAPVIGPQDIAGLAGSIKPIRSIEHPAMQELLWMLGNVKPQPEAASLRQALAQRVTSSQVPPSKEIVLPRGWMLSGYTKEGGMTPAGGRGTWVNPAETTPAPKLATGSRYGSGPMMAGMSTRLKNSGLTEDMIRDIRKKSSFQEAQAAYPNMKKATLRGIFTGDVYGWVK